MFSQPFFKPGLVLPELPLENAQFQALIKAVGIELDPSADGLRQLTGFALNNWLNQDDLRRQLDSESAMADVPAYQLFRQAGMIDSILPRRNNYDYFLVDGGKKYIYDYRLAYIDKLSKRGINAQQVTLFGGQSLRNYAYDKPGSLEALARELLSKPIGSWERYWLKRELSKDPLHPSVWSRPFATEHEIATLVLLHRYTGRLRYIQTMWRRDQATIDVSIPPVTTKSEIFYVDGKIFTVMNAPAVTRRFLGSELPVSAARPTGKSCIREWVAEARPADGASALLITHNPDIFRSWLDGLIALNELRRTDIIWDGAGDAAMPDQPYGDLLQSLGRLFVNFQYARQEYAAASL